MTVHVLHNTVIPKVCSTDHWWSARLAQVVRQSLYKSVFCALQSIKIFLVVWKPLALCIAKQFYFTITFGIYKTNSNLQRERNFAVQNDITKF